MTHERLKKLLSYDAKTGVFRWRVTITSRALAGQIAGCKTKAGYVQIRLDGKSYLAHQLAWFYQTKGWVGRLDHKDENKANNRFLNLRPCTHSENMQNISAPQANSKSGIRGVCKCPQTGKWMAYISADKKRHHLGRFDTPEEARLAYQAARKILHINHQVKES